MAKGVSFEKVFEKELNDHIMPRRALIAGKKPPAGEIVSSVIKVKPAEALNLGLSGIALSGGGIRSASFNLGILQALAKHGVLKMFDYLSTVSGGGYIGSGLTSLCADGVAGVDEKTFPFRFDGDKERPEIKHLRQHSEYLAPQHSLVSLDTWRLVASYLSGLLISLVTITAILGLCSSMGIVLYPRLAHVARHLFMNPDLHDHGSMSVADSLLTIPPNFWENPATYRSDLFAPTFFALILWLACGLAYILASVWDWNLSWRRGNLRWQGRFLRLAALLAVLGALPWIMLLLDKAAITITEPRGMAFWGTLGASAFSLIGAKTLSEEARTLMGKFKKILVLVGAWAFMFLFCLTVLFVAWKLRAIPYFVIPVCLGTISVISYITDINRISMFYFYRDRLSEAFIMMRRTEDGSIESNDSMPMSAVLKKSKKALYPLVNTTVNLPGSPNLDLRGRKSDFFLLSPFYCGSDSTSYVPTEKFESNRLGLASAMAISGAATNPQYGTGTTPAMTFLMALLNVRLGVWVRSPFRGDWNPLGWNRFQRFWPGLLIKELLSWSKESDRFVSLSDGGHIENLGVYELLRRKCTFILASDAGADPKRSFEDLGNLIRKARIDFGVQILYGNVAPLRPQKETGYSKRHVAVFQINYPNPPGESKKGTLIYVKTALTDNDTEDLHQYQRDNPQFPHESTLDQFFDEAQFESYRQLGYVSGKAASDILEPGTLRVKPQFVPVPPNPPSAPTPRGETSTS